MTLSAVADDLTARLVARLYDEKGGHYLLMMLRNRQFVTVRPLSRAEALTFVCKHDQVLRHVYPDAVATVTGATQITLGDGKR